TRAGPEAAEVAAASPRGRGSTPTQQPRRSPASDWLWSVAGVAYLAPRTQPVDVRGGTAGFDDVGGSLPSLRCQEPPVVTTGRLDLVQGDIGMTVPVRPFVVCVTHCAADADMHRLASGQAQGAHAGQEDRKSVV